MDENLIERMRADAERVDADGTDVDALVRGALDRGRRRRTRRRVLGAASGLVAAVLVAAGAATVVPDLLHGGRTAVPAASSPVVVTASPSPVPTGRTPRATPTGSVDTGRVSGRPAAVGDTLSGLLPGSLRVVTVSSAREPGSDGFAWENNTALTVRDAKGTSYLFGGIGDGHYQDGCMRLADCEKHALPDGGTLWISSGPSGDKTGQDRNFYVNRPDGGHVWLSERNAAGGSVPPTREGLPLTDAAGRAIVTGGAWDALFTG